MDILIKYRNDRKKEGASKGELNGLDGRINASMSDGVGAMDLELLTYRKAILDSGNHDLVARLDKHIFHVLGSKPAHIVDVMVSTASTANPGVPVAVDLANENVGDLDKKARAALGLSTSRVGKLIFRGLTHEDMTKPLTDTPLRGNDMVIFLTKFGDADMRFAQNYAKLCDGMLHDARTILATLSVDKLHELFVVVSDLKSDLRRTPIPLKQNELIWESVSYSKSPGLDEPILCKSLGNTRSEEEAQAVAKLCEHLSEKVPAPTFSSNDKAHVQADDRFREVLYKKPRALSFSNDDDLYN